MAPFGVIISYALTVIAIIVTVLFLFTNISLPNIGTVESFIKTRELMSYGIATGVTALSTLVSILMIVFTHSRQHMIGNKRTLLIAASLTLIGTLLLLFQLIPLVIDWLQTTFG